MVEVGWNKRIAKIVRGESVYLDLLSRECMMISWGLNNGKFIIE